MEKFAVDLDKVLDELEFNEDRAENLMAAGGRRHIASIPPAISHDHVVPHMPFESGDSGNKWRPKPVPLSQKTSVSGVFSSLNEYLNSGRVKSTPTASDNSLGDECSTAQLDDSCPELPVWSPTVSSNVTSFDEKPDLIDSSVLRPCASVTLSEAEVTEDRQSSQGMFLPDIAKAGTSGNPAACDDASLDPSHKSDTSDIDSDGDVDLETNDYAKAELQPQTTLLSFNSLNVNTDVNDDELNDYLSDLELEEQEQEKFITKVSSAHSSSCNNANHDPHDTESQNESQSSPQICNLSEPQAMAVDNATSAFKEAADGESLCDDYSPSIGSTSVVSTEPSVVTLNSESNQLETTSKESSPIIPAENETSEALDQVDQNALILEEKEVLVEPSVNSCEYSPQLSGETTEEICKESIRGTEELSGIPEASIHKSIDVSTSQSFDSASCVEEESPAVGQANMPDDSSLSLPPFSNSSSEQVAADIKNEVSAFLLGNNPTNLEESDCIPKEPSGNLAEDVASSLAQEKKIPLTLTIDNTLDIPSNSSSPATPPTVPVTPTLQDQPVPEEFSSTVSTSSTPFLTPVAVISESSSFTEQGSIEEAVSSTAVSAPEVEAQPDAAAAAVAVSDSDPCQKPVRPSSLEIPVRTSTEPAPGEATESSDGSPVAFNATVGPPGATPSANKPSIAETLAEPQGQGTDESATESSVEEAACGAAGGDEPREVTDKDLLLGREPPFWVPDADAPCCMQCDFKFTVLKRRHHCRACGKVLCSKCCSEKAHLEYINAEARVCVSCKLVLVAAGVASPVSPQGTNLHPNPNNPMEYCSTVPPLLQVAGSSHNQTTPTVMVPVGVLKREGSTKPKSEAKQVMFSDGIRPGADLAELDGSSEPRLSIRRTGRTSKRVGTPPGNTSTSQRTLLPIDGTTLSYVPHGKGLPPVVFRGKDGIQFQEDPDPARLLAVISDDSAPPVKFTINRNLYVLVKILNLDCCVNRVCWCFTSDGLSSVGQDEIVIILEMEPEELSVPKDIFIHLNTLYMEAAKGNTVTEMGHTLTQGSPFLGSREHGGFLYVRPTFQCLHRLVLPPAPYLVGVLIHKWETPWARIFPIRLMLRLGAEFRYYPCPLVSIRQRSAVYGEIGHTIIQVLADFRNMAYTLPTVRGLVIHMEDKQTTILLPRNRYDQVMRALNNSNDHVLAFGANFSQVADSHLVCMQSDSDHSYHTQAINIHNKPRKVTGASFVVFNGALKVSCGMAAKSAIVEDGLMVKVTSETMASLKTSLRDMKDLSITCGPINPTSESSNAGAGSLPSDEVVLIKWAEDDRSFNIGVLSSVDGRPLDGVPSIRVHNGTDYHGEYRFIRWTEVFILESEEGSGRTGDPVDISRLSEQLAKATCLALVKLLDLLAAANLTTLAVRATIHPENVGYLAGSNGEKLPPIYMNSLDDELVPVLHEAGLMSGESPAVLELVFRIMESG